MRASRFGGSGRAPRLPKPDPPVRQASTSWPPGEFSVHATLVQNGCVKCRRPQFRVRHFWAPPRGWDASGLASVCDPCWSATVAALGAHEGNLGDAFWRTKPVRATGEPVVNLGVFDPPSNYLELLDAFAIDTIGTRLTRSRPETAG